jgi:hypothetical protein
VKFKPLLDRWKKHQPPQRTATEYAVRLPLDDASRLQALIELFPGLSVEEIVTDLLHAGLDEIAAAMPYEPGPVVISRDDHGDPVYEDIGMTPRFVELARKHKKSLEAGLNRAEGAPPPEAARRAPPAPERSVPVRSTPARSTQTRSTRARSTKA